MLIIHRFKFGLFFWLLLVWPVWVATADSLTVQDARGRVVFLAQPAQRIVSLAPNITELLFAVGAGDKVVGAADYSDYPPLAKQIPRVGGYDRFDLESVLALHPDLVVGWPSGNPVALLDKLEKLGVTLFMTDPHHLDDIPLDLERLGQLTGNENQATQEAARFRQRRAQLGNPAPGDSPVRLFYQVWHQPLMTVNGEHLISDIMALCGGENIFASLSQLAPVIDVEAVLAANPEAIIASGMGEQRPEWLDQWRVWSQLIAVKQDNLFFIPPDLIQRHTPRILDGATMLCQQLATARKRRL